MADDYISRAEHEEFCRRMEEQNERQDHRLGILEDDIKGLSALNTSIEKLAINMENMLKEQVKQGERLETLEQRDGESWRKAVSYAITVIIGAVLGFLLKQLGM